MSMFVEQLPSLPGTYALAASLSGSSTLQIGKLGRMTFAPGIYVYVGSAFGPGGLAARLGRHMSKAKKNHWHFDYLSRAVQIQQAWMDVHRRRIEHRWAELLASGIESATPIKGFGCSDCTCTSHLYHCPVPPSPQIVHRLFRPDMYWVHSPGGTWPPP